MFAEERHRGIVDRLRRTGKVTVEELTAEFGVSSPTIRTDLTRLEEQGLLRRTHGGAIALGQTLYEPPYAERAVLRQREKRAIAVAAASLVAEGETVILDAGTTCLEIARRLKEFHRLTVVTNSLASAQVLSENDGIQTVVIGGVLQRRREATLGPLATQFLDPIQCDHAFVAVSGIDAVAGLTVIDFDAAQIKRRMLEKAAQPVVVADSSKIGQVAFAAVGPVNLATLLITDSSGTAEQRAALEEAGLPVTAVE
jgi:DeoR/GlpR family transcriptional regulator of sugar metabolism